MRVVYKILFGSSKNSFLFISFIIFASLFSFIFTWSIINSTEKYIDETSKDFLWADLVIESKDNFLNEKKEYIEKKYEAETSKKIEFSTSIFSNNKPELFNINYIEKNYPFYWEFKEKIINPEWELIVDKNVYDKFKEQKIEILWKKYSIKSYLESNFLADFNPFWWNNIYLDYGYFDNTLSSSISRIEYELLLKTDKVKEIKKDKDLSSLKIESEQSTNSSLKQLTDRLSIFIQVFYQIIILLTFFIVTISLTSYFKKITKDLKTINILWLSSYKIILGVFICFFAIALFSSTLSYISVAIIFEYILGDFETLKADITLLYKSIFLSFLIIVSWSFINLINLKATGLNNYSQNNFLKKYRKYIIFYLFFLFIILFLVSNFSWLDKYTSIFLSAWFILFIIAIISILNIILKFNFEVSKNVLKKNFYIFDSIRSTIKPWNLSTIIIVSTVVSISWFLVFSSFWNWFINFLDKQSKGQIDTFVINLNDEDIQKLKWEFKEDDYYEIIRSRILEINWESLKNHLKTDNVSWRFSREFNTTTKDLSDLIIKWKKINSWEVGVDEKFAEDLWVKIWDKIRFLILWIEKELEIVQIRKAERNWVSPFFYFNFYEWDFKWFSRNYFLSYNSEEKKQWFSKELKEKLWDSATFIDIKNIIEKVKNISSFILKFVYIILWYIAIFSIITFIVSINFLKKFKNKKVNLYNKFGWNKQKLKRAIFYEYWYLIFIWLIISIIISFAVALLIFNNSEFLDFNIAYFSEPIIYILGFLWSSVILYFIVNKYSIWHNQ